MTTSLDVIRDAFNAFDRDGDDTLSCTELGTMMASIGVSLKPTDIEDIYKKPLYTRQESIDITSKYIGKKDLKKDMAANLKAFDRGGRGELNALELASVLKSVGDTLNEKDIDILISGLDKKQDGKILLNDLVEYITS